mmetsp:Transcript_72149/g.143091  ORF Transcript_72149/g.143091 Transcript_72149/m.143091 type:complete len:452 (+) Transcript_72149:26-1381(+)
MVPAGKPAEACDKTVDAQFGTYRERMLQTLLLGATRGICQFGRIAWAPLAIFVSRDLRLSTVQQAKLLSAFPLGYMLTQIVGGVAADRFGGKSVQTVTLMVFAIGMLFGPTVADLSGMPGLYVIYFSIGIFAGPQHPACSAMTSAWVPQSELGLANSVQDACTIAGELLATLVAPVSASLFGWKYTFTAIGVIAALYCALWMLLAQSRPGETSAQQGAEPAQSKAAWPPLKALLYPQIWSAVLQHMCFNGNKYFFTSWMATYYDKVFHLGPEQSAPYLSAEKLIGISAPLALRALEAKLLLGDRKQQLLHSRKIFALVAFGINALVALCLQQLDRFSEVRDAASAPLLVSVLLCVNAAAIAAHGFGFKANYGDLTAKYSGAFMGFGNMLASFMTFVVPLGAAFLIGASGGNWSSVFLGIAVLNFLGFGFSRFMSTSRLDVELDEPTSKKSD